MKTVETAKPLALKNAYNVRDIGYYCNREGKKLKEGNFLRADSLSRLTPEDWQKLKKYGVVSIVDLRSPEECTREPFDLQAAGEIFYDAIPLSYNIQSNDGNQAFLESLHALYVQLLDNSSRQIAVVLRNFLKNKEGCHLFNCTAGKDRTGVIAMLLLGLADVDEETIVADYSTSAENMKPVFAGQIQAMKEAGYGAMSFLLRSEPEDMRLTLEHVNCRYGGIRNYLTGILSEEEVDQLRRMLVAS